jgi:MFS superfamily sulfate permease-like transporter
LDDVLDLLPGAFAITLFILSEALGVGYSLSSKYEYDIDANQELMALGVSMLGGLVSGCSVSSTAVNDRAGARSQVSSLAAATMVLIALVALMPLFHNLPQAILSAIVIHAVARMMRVAELKRFYRFQPSELGLALVALFGVVTVGILPGLGIAVVLSLLRFIWGASHLPWPSAGQGAFLSSHRGRTRLRSRPRNPASRRAIVFRQCASLPQ